MLLPSQQKASRSGCVRRKYLQQVTKTAVRPCEGRGGKHILIWSTRNSNVLAIKRKPNRAILCFGIKEEEVQASFPSWLPGCVELTHAWKLADTDVEAPCFWKAHTLSSASHTRLHFPLVATGRRGTGDVAVSGKGQADPEPTHQEWRPLAFPGGP